MTLEPSKYNVLQFKILIGDLNEENKYSNSSSEILSNIYHEAVKLKAADSMNVLSPKTLLDACEILATFIHSKNTTQINIQHKLAKQIHKSSVASLTILIILTSSGIHKSVYSENVIDVVIEFVQGQLYICCRDQPDDANGEETENFNKMLENMQLALNLVTELVILHTMVDFQINKISSIGLYVFGNGCSRLKIHSIKLLSAVFSKYESQQKSLLNDIQEFAVKCASHEELIPSFPIAISSKHISVFSALVMSLLQSISVLSEGSSEKKITLTLKKESLDMEYLESFLIKKYKKILLFSQYVTYEFLRSCLEPNGHHMKYYTSAFADFLHDLLSVLMEPEWPVSMILLSDIAKHLANVLHSSDVSSTVQMLCTCWLSEIMVKIKDCAQLAENNIEKLDQIIKKVDNNYKKYCLNNETPDNIENRRRQYLQKIFLTCIIGKTQTFHSPVALENFYIIKWSNELNGKDIFTPNILSNERKDKIKNKPFHAKKLPQRTMKEYQKESLMQLEETRKFVSFVNSLNYSDDSSVFFNNSDMKLIISYFMNNSHVMIHFNIYFTHIINMLQSKQPSVRAKTMQCLKQFMDVDTAFAEKPLIQFVMQQFLKDSSITVREISVDLIGNCMFRSPEKCEYYYHLISPHLLDKGVSVRKQVLKMLRDVTTLYPNLPSLPEVYLKILERIEDPSLKPMVLEMLKSKWFTPLNDSDKMRDQITNLKKVVNMAGVVGLQCLKYLFEELFDSNETVRYCKQFVGSLVHYLLEHEVNNSIPDLCDCLKLLNIIAHTKPDILVSYITALQPYLSLNHQEDESIILSVIGILKYTLPLLDNPSEVFLAKLEEDLLKLLFLHKHSVVESAVACLVLVIKELTLNEKLLFDSFQMFFGIIKKFVENKLSSSNQSLPPESCIQRSLLITGLFLKEYDFSNPRVQEFSKEDLISDVFNTFFWLLRNSSSAIKLYTLKAVGEMCCQYPDYLLSKELKTIYCDILTSASTEETMKSQVLKNLQFYLQIETRGTTYKNKRSKRSPINDVSSQKKTMNLHNEDENSSLNIIIIQQYLKQILNCCICSDVNIRCTAAIILQNVVEQGLIPPQKVVAHLIALTTDLEVVIGREAYNMLQQIDQLHPGVFDFCSRVGINLSYKLQCNLQKNQFVRGYRDEPVPSNALLTHVYQIVQRNKLRRRNFLRIILQEVEETEMDIDKTLYFTENLAFLPYELEEEILFIIQSIDLEAATEGFDFIQVFEQQLLPDEPKNKKNKETDLENDINDSDQEENSENLMDRLPADTKHLQKCVYSFQRCLLLLKVKYYLQHTYGISDRMIILYSSEQERGPFQINLDKKCTFLSDSYLQVLFEMKSTKDISNEELINQYMELKSLVLIECGSHPKKTSFTSQEEYSQEEFKEQKQETKKHSRNSQRGRKREFIDGGCKTKYGNSNRKLRK